MTTFKVLILTFTFNFAFANGAVIQNPIDSTSAPSLSQADNELGKPLDGENRKGRFLLLDRATATGLIGAVIGTAVTPLFGPLAPFVGAIGAPHVSNVIHHLEKSDIEDVLSRSVSNSAIGSYTPHILSDPRLGQLIVLKPSLPGLQPIILQNSVQDLYANNQGYLKQDTIEDRFVVFGKPGTANHHDCNQHIKPSFEHIGHHDDNHHVNHNDNHHVNHNINHNVNHNDNHHVNQNGNYIGSHNHHSSGIFKPENWVYGNHGKPGYTKTDENDNSDQDKDEFIRSLLK